MQPPDLEEAALRTRLIELEQEHSDLDAAIDAMASGTPFNQLQIQRMKKRKLALKDEISRLHDILLPDIIA